MGYNIKTKRSKFFKELSAEKQKEFFNLKSHKVLPCIDNIYYSIFIENDLTDNADIASLIVDLKEKKQLVLCSHNDVPFFDDLLLTVGGFNIYKYRLSSPELFDVFILDYLPNENTPRILIQLRAYGLWIYGYNKMLSDSYSVVLSLFKSYFTNINFSKVRENRIDYCYHTNCITNPYKEFSDANIEKTLTTEFKSFGFRGHLENNNNNCKSVKVVKDYFSLGERSSNNIFVRIYNKGLEVVELAYKSFFFAIWYQNGLINLYDKFCYEYAYEYGNYDYIHKAKLEFYVLYGNNENIKVEFKNALNKDLAVSEYKIIASEYMPDVTQIINIEFETKRKFYYYSDNFINSVLKFRERSNAPYQLQRIFKILDNRHIFLDYLTSKTLAFINFKDIEENSGDYVDWWKRLRRVKHKDVVNCDIKLVRDYSRQLDKSIIVKRAVNAVSTVALYNNNVDCDFVEDVSDLMANLNDNTMKTYYRNKMKKYKRLKNMLE